LKNKKSARRFAARVVEWQAVHLCRYDDEGERTYAVKDGGTRRAPRTFYYRDKICRDIDWARRMALVA
jgi:hypothetical protein